MSYKNTKKVAGVQFLFVVLGATFITIGLDLSWQTGVGIAFLTNALAPVVYDL